MAINSDPLLHFLLLDDTIKIKYHHLQLISDIKAVAVHLVRWWNFVQNVFLDQLKK